MFVLIAQALLEQSPEELKEMGSELSWPSTYHLYGSSGDDLVQKAGGLRSS